MYKYVLWDPNESKYSYWELKHVESLDFHLSKQSTARGIPTKSSNATQVFEMQGPIASFDIDFVRFDYEEDVPNWDFLFTKDYIVRSTGNRYKGIDWYTAKLQTTRPYKFAIYWVPDGVDSPNQSDPTADPGLIPTGEWKVAVTNISYEVNSTEAGMGSFKISLTERR